MFQNPSWRDLTNLTLFFSTDKKEKITSLDYKINPTNNTSNFYEFVLLRD